MEAVGLKLGVGNGCTVLMPNGNNVEAEVVGFHGDRLYLMPTNDVFGLTPGPRSSRGAISGLCLCPAKPASHGGEPQTGLGDFLWATGCWGECLMAPAARWTASDR